MLKPCDRVKIKQRKKMWDYFDWKYPGLGFLNKNHSLNCYCSMCRMKTYMRRKENKQNRLKARNDLKRMG